MPFYEIKWHIWSEGTTSCASDEEQGKSKNTIIFDTNNLNSFFQEANIRLTDYATSTDNRK